MIDPAQQAPIIVLTGFLGAGKSTLLRRLMALPEFGASGLVINEFGDVAIDHDLVAAGLPNTAVTSTGCICCTAGADIRASVAEVHEAAEKLGRLPLPRVIVETTGLADPAPVVNQLVAGAVPALGLRDHVVARHYRLAGVVTVFDVTHGLNLLSQHPESIKQVAFADRIVLTKMDCLEADERDGQVRKVRAQLRQMNPSAEILDGERAIDDLAAVFSPRAYAPRDLGGGVDEWLDEAKHAHHHAHNHHHNHGHDHHHGHDHAHHHDHDHDHEHGPENHGVRSIGLTIDEPIDKSALVHAIDLIQMLHGTQILRLKGILAFKDDPGAAYVLQMVQHVVHPLSRLEAWPSADRRSRLVIITFGIDPGKVADMLLAHLKVSPVEGATLPAEV
ncbi:MAG: GTP-binding protein [Pseudomonadota bacterium]